jgi:5-methylcytosine-specific restriction endonuclease McrA
MKRTPLKRGIKQLKRTPIRRISEKQVEINKILHSLDSAYPGDSKCQKCHNLPDFRGLVKHHKVFRSRGGEHTKENIIWCCCKCHNKFHGIIEK